MHRIGLASMTKIVSLLDLLPSTGRLLNALSRCFVIVRRARLKPSLTFSVPIPHIHTSSWEEITENALMEGRLTKAEIAVASQMQEMELVRQKVYELERNQIQIKQR